MLSRYKEIDTRAPFAVVFRDVGLPWVGQIVSLGAVTGTMTAVLAMLVGQARIHMVLARERLLPRFLVIPSHLCVKLGGMFEVSIAIKQSVVDLAFLGSCRVGWLLL